MAIIYTKRLMLRPVRRSDIEDFFEYSHDPNVGPNSGWEPHEDRRRSRYVMKVNFLGNEFAWGIIFEDKLIGTISVDTDRKRFNNKVMMLGYSMSSKYWGRGIMSEAAPAVIEYMFDTYDIDGISIYCYPENKRSQGVIEKCGFEFEGILKKAQRRFDGKVFDNRCYLLTAERFASIREKLPIYNETE